MTASRDHAQSTTDGQGNPTLAASDAALTDWEPVADAVLAAFQTHADALARKFTEQLYGDFLDTVQDYLADNAKFNIAQRLSSAERSRKAEWERAEAATARARALEALVARAGQTARRYAGNYPEASDGRNTFIIYAEWIEGEADRAGVPQ